MNISIIGSGYVGLVTGACLAELGNRVVCADNDAQKINDLKKGRIPIYEPGLEALIRKNAGKKRIKFTSSIREAVKSSEVIFIAVGTPSLENGEADLTGIENVARNIAANMTGYRLVVEKSTVPVETGEWVRRTIASHLGSKIAFDVASNPEFLREGQAIGDFMHPDRIVIGVASKKARDILSRLYKPLGAPVVVTDIKSAELIKHASNSFLATKISFINAVSRIAEKVGADIRQVAEGMGLDRRIGPGFLDAGIGYGGSCFPKDVDAFVCISQRVGYEFELLREVREINRRQREFFFQKIKDALWILKDKHIAVWGLSFKPNTDDLRSAPSLDIIRALQAEGAKIRAYDPSAMKRAKSLLPKVHFARSPYEAARGCDCLLVLTEWDEFRKPDLAKLKKMLKFPRIIDGRNIFDPRSMKDRGFIYTGIGRGASSKEG